LARSVQQSESSHALAKTFDQSAARHAGGCSVQLTDRSKLVHCLITQAGLEKLVRQALGIGDFEMAFHTHRERIESTASRKYDSSATFYRPFTITPVDVVAYDSPVPLGQPA
jgi:hypothetical protein